MIKDFKKYSHWYYISAVVILGVIIIVGATLSWPADEYRTQSVSAPNSLTKSLALSRNDGMGEAMVMDLAMSEPPFFPEPTAGATAGEVDQRIIKTGSLGLVVDDVSDTATKISNLASEQGGFVQNSSVNEREDGTHSGNVTVRILAEQFENAMTAIKKLAVVVENESVSGQDVTEQYTDLQARLRNAQAQEATYLKILDQAESVEDILNVQRELGNIRYQIESLQGQMKYYENKTDYSTISVYLSEEPSVTIPSKEFRPWTSVKEAARALVVIAQNLAVAAIWVIIIGIGILLPLALIIWIIAKIVRRFKKTRR